MSGSSSSSWTPSKEFSQAHARIGGPFYPHCAEMCVFAHTFHLLKTRPRTSKARTIHLHKFLKFGPAAFAICQFYFGPTPLMRERVCLSLPFSIYRNPTLFHARYGYLSEPICQIRARPSFPPHLIVHHHRRRRAHHHLSLSSATTNVNFTAQASARKRTHILQQQQ